MEFQFSVGGLQDMEGERGKEREREKVRYSVPLGAAPWSHALQAREKVRIVGLKAQDSVAPHPLRTCQGLSSIILACNINFSRACSWWMHKPLQKRWM